LEVLLMRKVSIEIAKAFINNKNKKIGNSRVCPVSDWVSNGEMGIYLHDNKIAWWENYHPNETRPYLGNLSTNIHLCFSMCGWDTPTTRERLNTLFYELFKSDAVYLKQSKGDQYLYINSTCMKIDPSEVYTLREVEKCVFLDQPWLEENQNKVMNRAY